MVMPRPGRRPPVRIRSFGLHDYERFVTASMSSDPSTFIRLLWTPTGWPGDRYATRVHFAPAVRGSVDKSTTTKRPYTSTTREP
jgi:hypothetical protein